MFLGLSPPSSDEGLEDSMLQSFIPTLRGSDANKLEDLAPGKKTRMFSPGNHLKFKEIFSFQEFHKDAV